jgi:hypothetical protein
MSRHIRLLCRSGRLENLPIAANGMGQVHSGHIGKSKRADSDGAIALPTHSLEKFYPQAN